jgi:hypothetical protein
MSYLTDTIRRGTFANRPSSAPDGTVYVCTDGTLQFVMKNGVWNSYLGSMPLNTPPAASTWSLINATLNTSFSDSLGGLLFSGTIATGGANIAKVTAPATPYSITVHMLLNWGGTGSNAASWNFCYAGICWRETSTGNLHVFAPCHATTANGTYINTFRLLTASGTGSSGITYGNSTDFNIVQLTSNLQNNGVWLKGTDDGTNRIVSYSGDGVNFTQFHSITRTTSVTPNEVGIIAGNYATAGQSTVPNTFFTSVKIG